MRREMQDRRMFEGFKVPWDGPLTANERSWIELLRVTFNDDVPAPSLHLVQMLRTKAADPARRDRAQPG